MEVQIENSGSQFVFPVYFPIELIIFARWNRIRVKNDLDTERESRNVTEYGQCSLSRGSSESEDRLGREAMLI